MGIMTDNAHPHLGGNVENDAVNGDSGTFFPTMWKYLIDKYEIKSVFDVGCGLGYSTLWFKESGLEILGIDGLPYNATNAKIPIVQFDLQNGAYIPSSSFDMVWCSEVAEHVEERFSPNVIDTICVATKLLAVTIPDDRKESFGGFHHVNLKPHKWWIERIEAKGFKYNDEETKYCKTICDNGYAMINSGMIFNRIGDY